MSCRPSSSICTATRCSSSGDRLGLENARGSNGSGAQSAGSVHPDQAASTARDRRDVGQRAVIRDRIAGAPAECAGSSDVVVRSGPGPPSTTGGPDSSSRSRSNGAARSASSASEHQMTSVDVARVEGIRHDHADRAGVELQRQRHQMSRGGIQMPRQEERLAAGQHPGKVMIELESAQDPASSA